MQFADTKTRTNLKVQSFGDFPIILKHAPPVRVVLCKVWGSGWLKKKRRGEISVPFCGLMDYFQEILVRVAKIEYLVLRRKLAQAIYLVDLILVNLQSTLSTNHLVEFANS